MHDIDQVWLETRPPPLHLFVALAFGDLIQPDWKPVKRRLAVHICSFTGDSIFSLALVFMQVDRIVVLMDRARRMNERILFQVITSELSLGQNFILQPQQFVLSILQ